MDRYWRELESCARSSPLENTEFTNVFSREAPRRSQRASRLHRAFNKYLAYPWLVKQVKNVQILHLLDHSYANLLRSASPKARIVATVFDLVPLRDPDSLRQHQVARFRPLLKSFAASRQPGNLISGSSTTSFQGFRRQCTTLPGSALCRSCNTSTIIDLGASTDH
jgi:hypothetical protein